MAQNLVRFETWEQVLEAARNGEQLWYEAPMDAAQAYPAKQVVVRRVYKNGKLRLDPLSNQAEPFTADAGQLYRFRRKPHDEDVVGEYTEGVYRVRWYRSGQCVVSSTVNGCVQGVYIDGKWDDEGRLPDYVKAFCLKFQRSATVV